MTDYSNTNSDPDMLFFWYQTLAQIYLYICPSCTQTV